MQSVIWLFVDGALYFEGAFCSLLFRSTTAAGWRTPTDAAFLSLSVWLTISMILVFFPALFFLATMYCASATPPNRAHRLALAAAPTFTTAALSMVARWTHTSVTFAPSVYVTHWQRPHTPPATSHWLEHAVGDRHRSDRAPTPLPRKPENRNPSISARTQPNEADLSFALFNYIDTKSKARQRPTLFTKRE